jgi:hypothetical protein
MGDDKKTEKEINEGLQETLDKQKKDEELKKLTGSGMVNKTADTIIKNTKQKTDTLKEM